MQERFVSIPEAMRLLDLHSRVQWFKRLQKHGIEVVQRDGADCIAQKDIAALQEMQKQYTPLEILYEQNHFALSPVERMQTAKFLLRMGLVTQSEHLPYTDQIKRLLSREPHLATLYAVSFYQSLFGPEVENGVRLTELAKSLHMDQLRVACDLYLGKIQDGNLFVCNDFLYFKSSYAVKCEDYHKSRDSLNKLLAEQEYSPEQIVDRLAETFTCGCYDQYYIGSDEGWYCLRKEIRQVKKQLPQILAKLKLEQEGLPQCILDGKAYVQAETWAKQECSNPLFSLDKPKCRDHFKDFLCQNERELEIRQENNVLYLPVERTALQNRMLRFHFDVYGLSEKQIHEKLLLACREKMPVVVKLVQELRPNKSVQNGVLYQFMLHAKHDLPDFSQAEMDHMIKVFDRTSLAQGKCFQRMAMQVEQCYPCKFRSLPTFKDSVRSQISMVKEAYSLEQFACMAHCLFNPAYAQEQNLLSKACKRSAMAEAWLFLCLHWICALRPSDLQKIPILDLPESPQWILEQCRLGALPDILCEEIIDALAFQMQIHPWKPQKTQKYQVPNIKLFFPQSLKRHFGLLYLLVLAHRKLENRENKALFRVPEVELLRKFLGSFFVQQLNEGRFSSRSANKAFLQGIQEQADREGNGIRVEGYILASLARSHKFSDHDLSKITEVYLRDANFTGRTPEYYAQVMFDRGVLSFIPDLMLKILYGQPYEALPVSAQTKLIQTIGFTSVQIEELLLVSMASLQEARKNVVRLLQSCTKAEIRQGLEVISHGQAASKGPNAYCLRRALGQSCDHGTCIGCPYEMQTRADVYLLVRQYEGMMERYRNVKKEKRLAESEKYENIIRRLIPVITEAAAYLQEHEPDGSLLTWMREAIKKC